MSKARPHPAPLPQERENRSTVAGETGRAQLFGCSKTKWSVAEFAPVAYEFASRTDTCSLSPGERVRVRASVQPNYFPA